MASADYTRNTARNWTRVHLVWVHLVTGTFGPRTFGQVTKVLKAVLNCYVPQQGGAGIHSGAGIHTSIYGCAPPCKIGLWLRLRRSRAMTAITRSHTPSSAPVKVCSLLVHWERRRLKIQTQLQARGLGHSAWVPGRFKNNLHVKLFHRGQARKPALDVSLEDVRHPASWRGHGHVDVDLVSFRDGSNLAGVNQSQVNHVDGNFRIVNRPQLVPHQLSTELRWRCCLGRIWSGRGQTQRVSVFGVNAHHVPLVRHHRVAAAKRLHEPYLRASRQHMRDAGGYLRSRTLACQNVLFVRSHVLKPTTRWK